MKKMLISAITLALGLFMSVYYFTLFVKSYDKYNDGWGTDYVIDKNLFVKAACGLVILIAGAYALYQAKKGQDSSKTYTVCLLVVGILAFLYPIGMTFKMLTYWIQDGHAKYVSKYTWEYYLRISDYLVWAFYGAIILGYGAVRYFSNKLEK